MKCTKWYMIDNNIILKYIDVLVCNVIFLLYFLDLEKASEEKESVEWDCGVNRPTKLQTPLKTKKKQSTLQPVVEGLQLQLVMPRLMKKSRAAKQRGKSCQVIYEMYKVIYEM